MGQGNSWVYFARRPDGDIKIGTIVKHFFIQRMGVLWKQNGYITVMGVIEGGREKEAELHGIFHEYRRRSLKTHYRVYTEYFEPNDGLLTFIKENSVDLSQFKNKWQRTTTSILSQKRKTRRCSALCRSHVMSIPI